MGVAIVGMRNPSAYGRRMTQKLAAALAEQGITVISGLVRGIDAEAHQAAMDAGGRTIGVLGCGLNVNYPAGHEELRRRISGQGAVVTELNWNYPPRAENFPRRNRLISGLALATVVVEAAHRSGALLTARLALEQGRELMAVPGPVESHRSAGCHRILKEGAHLVESAEDIIAVLPAYVQEALTIPSRKMKSAQKTMGNNSAAPRTKRPRALNAEESIIFNCLEEGPNTTEGVTKLTSLRPETVSSILLTLELQGTLRQIEGGIYEII